MYGSLYIFIWQTLLEGLDNAANMTDFSEFKHQHGLLENLCAAICHVCCFIQPGDSSELQELLDFRLDFLCTHLRQCQERVAPEQAGAILQATNHIESISKSCPEDRLTTPGDSSSQDLSSQGITRLRKYSLVYGNCPGFIHQATALLKIFPLRKSLDSKTAVWCKETVQLEYIRRQLFSRSFLSGNHSTQKLQSGWSRHVGGGCRYFLEETKLDSDPRRCSRGCWGEAGGVGDALWVTGSE
ncbi:hypothetical protein GE061_016929 [Apolygus lucorum]|uniref:Uncharacterized protein n=1 Tax=Apolygus lucorum TaxID=248454 RepID=A0A8S9XHK2_APOLU|nr:hypothetical protein GE061_016929 [Apolygus lucorum]